METWRPVTGYDYEVSSEGRVRRKTAFKNLPVGFVLKPKITTHTRGYAQVALSRAGKYWHVCVNALVCGAFHGPKPTPEHEAAHWDGNKLNNTPDNLRWATSSENCLDKRRHGTIPDRKGELHPLHILTAELVTQMRQDRQTGLTYPQLAAKYQTPKLTVYDAVRGKTWTHLPGAFGRTYREKAA